MNARMLLISAVTMLGWAGGIAPALAQAQVPATTAPQTPLWQETAMIGQLTNAHGGSLTVQAIRFSGQPNAATNNRVELTVKSGLPSAIPQPQPPGAGIRHFQNVAFAKLAVEEVRLLETAIDSVAAPRVLTSPFTSLTGGIKINPSVFIRRVISSGSDRILLSVGSELVFATTPGQSQELKRMLSQARKILE